ncbi:serine protease [Azospirillum sp. HJ39]|uniref:S1 family peptidase n=1 Tax=Azospirillum sp. HJ39 TaxID=3159496 RepID=UPI003556E813
MKCFLIVLSLFVPLVCNVFAAQASENPNFKDALQLAIVHLTVNGIDQKTGRPINEKTGTGFFISEDQRILTAKHLFVGEDGKPLASTKIEGRIGVAPPNGRAFHISSDKLYLHPEHDFALLSANDPTLSVKVLPLCFDQRPKVADRVVALGFTQGKIYDQAPGEIRTSDTDLGGNLAEAMFTNAPINPGNSGGPVLSGTGSVVAIALGGSFYDNSKGQTLRVEGENAILPISIIKGWIADKVKNVRLGCGKSDHSACDVEPPTSVPRSSSGRTIYVEPYQFPPGAETAEVAANLNRIRENLFLVALGPRLSTLNVPEVGYDRSDLGIPPARLDQLRELGCSLNALGIVIGFGSLRPEPSGKPLVHLKSAIVLPSDARLAGGSFWVDDQILVSEVNDPTLFSERLDQRWVFNTMLAVAEKQLRRARTDQERRDAITWISSAATVRSTQEERQKLLDLLK